MHCVRSITSDAFLRVVFLLKRCGNASLSRRLAAAAPLQAAANPQVTSPGVALCRARHAHGGSRLRCGSLTIARIYLHPPTSRVPSASGSANECCHAASASQPHAAAHSPVPVLVARAQASWRHRTSSTARSTSTMTSSTGARAFFHFPRPDDARTCRLRPTAITLDV